MWGVPPRGGGDEADEGGDGGGSKRQEEVRLDAGQISVLPRLRAASLAASTASRARYSRFTVAEDAGGGDPGVKPSRIRGMSVELSCAV